MTRRELSKELQTREAVKAIDSRREVSINAGFMDRDTKQTEPAIAKETSARNEQLRTQPQRKAKRNEARAESAKAESRSCAESSDELESTQSLPVKLRVASPFVYVCVSLEFGE
jgi:hypothetical protein